ncbi:hypothetical protein KSI01_10800 [Kurthia sibirica]|nr:hypothetical protein KSI01_10800 [Kurthia sibirica]
MLGKFNQSNKRLILRHTKGKLNAKYINCITSYMFENKVRMSLPSYRKLLDYEGE